MLMQERIFAHNIMILLNKGYTTEKFEVRPV
ncbi:MAG: hypothetical protein KQ78_01924 [Candidatus Izimaplasma bacterium HR2]|nr:MAG: hypothetical protein KQ78_01924 [Candidatus Izimaplasma bacterium HR2]